jgi:hypothetical protein
MAAKARDASSLEALAAKFKQIGLNERLTAEALKSGLVRASLDRTIDETPLCANSTDPNVGALLYALASATQKGAFDTRPNVAKAIVDGRLKTAKQVEGINSTPSQQVARRCSRSSCCRIHEGPQRPGNMG